MSVRTYSGWARRWIATAVAIAALLAPNLVSVTPSAAAASSYDPFFGTPTTVADLGASTRPFGVAAGDYDEDGDVDLVIGRTTGHVAFVAGNGDGTFAAPSTFAWKQAFFNAWAFAPGDLNGDDHLDVVWGASSSSGGAGDGDVRVWYGNGDGTFVETIATIGGVSYNVGTLLADIGTDAGSITVGDIDGDLDDDVIAGAAEGVRILRNSGGSFTIESLGTSGVYFPTTETQNRPWGLALGDADGDDDLDLWVGDRALYVYLYANDGSGALTLVPGNIPSLPATRANVYIRHDTYRAAVGYTPSLASTDVNGDGKDDLFVGLHSATQNPSTGAPHDGEVILDVSGAVPHTTFGSLADLGTMTRGLQTADVDGDGASDVVGAVYEGQVKLLRQLPPLDTDGDGISDYVDNAPTVANAPRLDMNTDGAINHLDQLDNDFDTVLGAPEDDTTWQRLGDVVDPDDDDDGVDDGADNCAFTANTDQDDVDGDGRGDACDPLDGRDPDGDGVPTGAVPGDPLYDESLAAKIRWGEGDTHFVIRIDALSRFFQNEFTQLMADAAILTPAQWAEKCWENYGPGGGDPADPCGTGEGTSGQTLTLGGGKDARLSLVTIPKQLWTDPPVIDWINDRNDHENLDLAMHATYHASNTTLGDWASLPDRNFLSCELCGLTLAESVELLAVGRDTLLGHYDNAWVADSGATPSSPRIDWTTAANPLLSYAPPFNADDPTGREAVALLGFRAHSSSIYEEGEAGGSLGPIFTPEGSHHERFDQFGLFHASADVEFDPLPVPDGTYDADDRAAFAAHLDDHTEPGGLNTWLIEEVEWSGRPCNEEDRLGTCNGGSNREDNTVYLPRWEQWLQLLDHVTGYPGGVTVTMAEVALAKAFDNAPTVTNADQADSDNDGLGDVIDGATLLADDASLGRNVAGVLSATLTNGTGSAIAGQTLTFTFDADGDGSAEEYQAATGADGVATAAVTATRPVGPATFDVDWDGVRTTARDTGDVVVADATTVTLDAANPTAGQVSDLVTVGATLVDSDGTPLAGYDLAFTIDTATGTATTDGDGHASTTLTLEGPAASTSLVASFAGGPFYAGAEDRAPFTLTAEDATVMFDVDNPVSVRVDDGEDHASTVRLVATIEEEDDPDDAVGGTPAPGDLTRAAATMRLEPVGPGGPVDGACTRTFGAGAGYDQVMTLTCTFSDVPVNTYTVEVTADTTGHYAGFGEDVLTVYDPDAGFATGGGWFLWPDTGDRTTFGFTMKYTKKGSNVQGGLLLIRHLPDGTIYRVKSNALFGLAVGQETDGGERYGWATFSGKSTYVEPGWTDTVGNQEFVVAVTDRDDPGTGVDTFQIRMLDHPALTLDAPVPTGGGNIVVPHGGGGGRRSAR